MIDTECPFFTTSFTFSASSSVGPFRSVVRRWHDRGMAPTGSAKAMALWTTAFVVSQANIARLLGPVAPKVLEVQTAFSARRYVEILDSMDAEATARFRSHYYPPDFVHPAIYAMALRSAGTRLGGEWVPLSPGNSARPCRSARTVGGRRLRRERGRTPFPRSSRQDHRLEVRAASTVSIAKWVLALGTLGYLSQGFVRVWVSRK